MYILLTFRMATTNIYILKLESGKYYIGKSDNVVRRFEQHLLGNGSAWTKKYKALSLEKTIENVSPFEEDKVTKEYMAKYGIENVRGGSYVEVELSDFHIDALKMEIWAAKDLCTQCGRSGHFVKDCYATKDVSGNKIEFESESESEWECDYCDRSFTTEYGCLVHERTCKEKKSKKTKQVTPKKTKESSSKKEGVCYRCGRPGHYSPDCYARTHKDGYELDSDDDSEE